MQPETPFERRILERSMWYREYGCPKDPGELPEYEYQAHMALLEGVEKRREKERKKAEKDAENAT